MPRKYENLNSGLREQVKQKTELPLQFKDTFPFRRRCYNHLWAKAHKDFYQNLKPLPCKRYHLDPSCFKHCVRTVTRRNLTVTGVRHEATGRRSRIKHPQPLDPCAIWRASLPPSLNTLFRTELMRAPPDTCAQLTADLSFYCSSDLTAERTNPPGLPRQQLKPRRRELRNRDAH